ncbi:MAG: isochorismatase family protein [Blautia sp.]|nr:isochorismatase family protein [Lachnoclostridium sp.]MCM1211261.1 isochorismatase family protein [Blautia sp.]
MKKALLVIDMQNVCVGENHAQYFKYNNTDLIKAVNGVIEANKNNMVIYIKNIMKKNFLNKFAPFHAYEGTEDAALVNNLQIVSENVYTKYKGNAFSNAALNEFLKKNDITCVEVVGVDGGGCVALTALGAMKEGYQVIVNENAIGTMFIEKRNKYFKQLKDAGAEFI